MAWYLVRHRGNFTISKNNIADVGTGSVEFTPNLEYWNDVWQQTFEKYATFVNVIFVQNVEHVGCMDFISSFPFMAITNEPLES
jgi:hypothetical protein